MEIYTKVIIRSYVMNDPCLIKIKFMWDSEASCWNWVNNLYIWNLYVSQVDRAWRLLTVKWMKAESMYRVCCSQSPTPHRLYVWPNKLSGLASGYCGDHQSRGLCNYPDNKCLHLRKYQNNQPPSTVVYPIYLSITRVSCLNNSRVYLK